MRNTNSLLVSCRYAVIWLLDAPWFQIRRKCLRWINLAKCSNVCEPVEIAEKIRMVPSLLLLLSCQLSVPMKCSPKKNPKFHDFNLCKETLALLQIPEKERLVYSQIFPSGPGDFGQLTILDKRFIHFFTF